MVAGTNIPSHHAEGRALDLGLRAWIPTEKWLGDELFEIFVGDVNPRDVDEVIWNRQIWSAQRPYVHVHHGANPHIDLIHVGFTRAGSQKSGFAYSFIVKIAVLHSGMEDVGQRVGGSFSA
jgi:hypothetical protein